MRVYVGDVQARFKVPPKTIPMWAYLLLNRDQWVSRQKLAFTLWPEAAEEEARTNLRRHIYHLRHALQSMPSNRPWLVYDAETVGWNPEADYWLDVDEFERFSKNPETTMKAVELYAGDLLEDQYDDWIFYPREHFRNLYIADLQQLIQRFWSQQDYPNAISCVNRLLTLDPFREDAVRQLMALRYESGDRSGSLRDYERFILSLRQELSIDPMPETIALYEMVFRDKGLAIQAGTGEEFILQEKRDRQVRLPFVGRERDIETLKGWWSRAARRQASLVMIGGEAGVGKTRLVEEFAHIVENQGGRVLKGSTFPEEQAPYQSIVIAFRSALPMLAALDIDPHWLAAVATLIPELRTLHVDRRRPLPVMTKVDPETDRARLYEAFTLCLEELARTRPVLLILEDLHWATASTISLLEYITRRLVHHPLMVLTTYRQDEARQGRTLAEFRRELQRENLLVHMALERLTLSAITNLVSQLAGKTQEISGIAERLFTASEGNPLFLLELIRDLLEQGSINIQEGMWNLSDASFRSIPNKVSSMILERIGRLPARSRSLAEIAAVIGPVFDVELACLVSGWSESQVLDCLDELMDQLIVREVMTGSRFDYTFTHDLIQYTIYEATSLPSRKRRHRRVAHIMEKYRFDPSGDLAGVLAAHFDRGGEPERAARYYLKTAQWALATYADDEALSALDCALKSTTEPHLCFKLLLLREDIWHRRGERQAQEADLLQLIGLASDIGGEEGWCEVLLRQIRLRHALGDRQMEGELITALKLRAISSGMERWQAEALRAEATYQILLGQYDIASACLKKALPLFESCHDIHGQVACYCLSIEIATHRSLYDTIKSLSQRAYLLAESSGDQSLLVGPLRTAAGAAFANQEYEACLTLSQQMIDLCRTISDREGEADALTRLGTSQARLFRVQEARQSYQRATVLYDKLGKRQGQAAVRLNAGILANRLGHYSQAILLFEQAGELFNPLDDLRGQMLSALNLSAAAIFQEDFPIARRAAQHGLDLARQLKIPFVEANALGNLGECDLNLGYAKQAIQHLEAGLAIRHEHNLPEGDSSADLAILAIAYLQAGEMEKARQISEKLVELVFSINKADQIAYPQQGLWAAAQVFRVVGDIVRSQKLVEEAYTLLQEKTAVIPDAESREAFLKLPFNRKVLQAYEEGRIQ